MSRSNVHDDAPVTIESRWTMSYRRGPMTRLYPSQFALIGSMNPEEGTLRPQILDRFGLRVWVAPLAEPQQSDMLDPNSTQAGVIPPLADTSCVQITQTGVHD